MTLLSTYTVNCISVVKFRVLRRSVSISVNGSAVYLNILGDPHSMSAEPYRRRAYDKDLRWRIVYQRAAIRLSFARIAQNLNVSLSTAHRIYHRFELSGDVCVSTASHSRRYDSALRKLQYEEELYIIGAVIANPASYLHEVCQELKDAFDIIVSPSSICRLLHSYGITRKKIRQVALQRSYTLRGAFRAQCSLFESCLWMKQGQTTETMCRSMGMQ